MKTEAQAQRSAAVDQGIQAILGSVRRAAEAGTFTLYFQVPREFVSETLTILKSLDYGVTMGTGNQASAAVEVAVSWAAAAKEVLATAQG